MSVEKYGDFHDGTKKRKKSEYRQNDGTRDRRTHK